MVIASPATLFKMGGSVAGLIVSVTWTETALGSFFYLLRVVSNWQFTGRFRWDFTIATATVVSVSFKTWPMMRVDWHGSCWELTMTSA